MQMHRSVASLPDVAKGAVGLEVFLGVGALLGGGALLLGPRGEILPLPISALNGSPFDSYFVPGLILFGVLGVGALVAAGLGWFRHPLAPFAAFAVGIALLVWLGVEIAIVGYSNNPPLQAFYLLLGSAITAVALRWLDDAGALADVRAHARAIGFVMRLLPLFPTRPIDWVTRAPAIDRVTYTTLDGEVDADLYRPPGRGPHPAVVMCLGVVPFGVDHPQVARLGAALARFGFVALIHWSPAMRDRRLVPEDGENIARAYDWLVRRTDVDPARSGLFGTCVGGSFALLAAAHPLIRDRLAFVGAFAPFSSMWTLCRDVASRTRTSDGPPEPWQVDPLTREVFVRSVTDTLDPGETERLREACTTGLNQVDPTELTADGGAVCALLAAPDRDAAQLALERLPDLLRDRLDAMSPLAHVSDIHAPLILIGHDRDDLVVPVGESRRLAGHLSDRAGAHYTEYAMFEHADPTKRKLAPLRLASELRKFYLSLYPMFRQAVA